MKLLSLLLITLLLNSCATYTPTNTAKPSFYDYESRLDELTGETQDYYTFSPYYVNNSRSKISLDGSTRDFSISFCNKFDKSISFLEGKEIKHYQFKTYFATIEYHTSLSEGNGLPKMYLEIDSNISQINLELKTNQNKTKEKVSESSMTMYQSTTVTIPATTESTFNYNTNQFETRQIPSRTESVTTPVTTNSQSISLSHTIFNQFNWPLTEDLVNRIISAKTIRLKLHQENNDFWVKIPEYKLVNLKKFLKHDYRE